MLVVAIASDQSGPDRGERLRHEFALRDMLDPAWAARPLALTHENGRTQLELADPGGERLSALLQQRWEIGTFLRVAVGMSDALGRVHTQGLVHKDIKPEHFLVDSDTGAVWLTGFGIASRLVRERHKPDPPEAIAGSLAYMAPEQTGRMNRSVDARSDLYALGVTFYQMLAGELPFTASDLMELVHCHIARQPLPLINRDIGTPAALSAIIMKLLAKAAEERYQTAAGVASDLRQCLAQWEMERSIEAFTPGLHDRPDQLLIPEKLYGREWEVETLLNTFDRVVQGGPPELVLVSGYSGIGKSSVVHELHKALVPPRGLFASGKFDQYKRDIPYATLAQAFQTLVRGLLAKSDDDLVPWREAFAEALGPNGRLVTELVPELTMIVGEQPPVPELAPQDARGRFQRTLRQFICVFARPEHPLALFLDDLQWLDAGTLDVLEDLVTRPELRHLLVIGAYRDHEVAPTHALMRTLAAIRSAGTPVHDIVLVPLTRADIGSLVGDALHSDHEASQALAELIHERTAGNPFFAIQFLSSLGEEELLRFDHGTSRWSWDLDRIRAKAVTDNVVDLMVSKLNRLPSGTQKALQQLACLGDSADLALMEKVHEGSAPDLYRHLQQALHTGLVLSSAGTCRFLHDRVQEAAYSLIPEAQRAHEHLRIGRLMTAHVSSSELQERIFDIVNQLNRGVALITHQHEKEHLAELNLIAGKRAKESTAYVSGLRYLVTGAQLLEDDGWNLRPDLMFGLELHRAECEFLTGELAGAERRLAMLVPHARSRVEQATVASLRIHLYTTMNRSDLGVDVGLQYLRQLGIDLPRHATEEDVRREYDRTWLLLDGRKIEELIDLPVMSDPESIALAEVMDKTLEPALLTELHLFPLLLWRMVNLGIEHGNTDASCYAYVNAGAIAGTRFGDYQTDYRFGQLAYDLVEQRGLRRFAARAYVGFSVFTMSWTRHWRIAREVLQRAFNEAVSSGDVTYAAYSCHNLVGNFLAAGDPLDHAQREAERMLQYVQSIGFGIVADNISNQLALIRMLRGLTVSFGRFDCGEFNELQNEHRLLSDPALAFAACWYWIRKLQARFFAADYPAAIEASAKAQELIWISKYFVEAAELSFYGALSHAACCDHALPDEHRKHVELLTACHRQLSQWAEHGPENFENRVSLVGAELARIERRELEAQRLYEAAIRSAREHGFVQNEGIAYELAARFYRDRGYEDIGTLYLRKARQCYLRWGAIGKVRQLDSTYPEVREDERAAAPTSTTTVLVEGLDMATVVKVSQALSGEIVLENMLDKLMRIAIENAGAGRGLLTLARPGEHWIAAEVSASGDTVDVQMRNDSLGKDSLPLSVYHYVLRTHQSVILDNASARGPFTADPYIRQRHARSILCIPLLKQSVLVGVLYLENPLATRAFTPERIAVLDLLASQAAIALENARLYKELQKAQRLEAMGTLAGGIAHDFNNILGAILGYGEMAQRSARKGTQLRRDLDAIMVAGERGRALVERVLAFSRSGVADPVAVHASQVVREGLGLLSAQVSDMIRLDEDLCTGNAAVLGDATQLHQIVMNLCTNAAQAMPDGGVLSVSLRLECVETHRACLIGGLDQGEYIVLVVADTGVGISAQIIDRIFDPFFTTKDIGSALASGYHWCTASSIRWGAPSTSTATLAREAPSRCTCLARVTRSTSKTRRSCLCRVVPASACWSSTTKDR